MPEIDIDDLKKNTDYNGYRPADKGSFYVLYFMLSFCARLCTLTMIFLILTTRRDWLVLEHIIRPHSERESGLRSIRHGEFKGPTGRLQRVAGHARGPKVQHQQGHRFRGCIDVGPHVFQCPRFARLQFRGGNEGKVAVRHQRGGRGLWLCLVYVSNSA